MCYIEVLAWEKEYGKTNNNMKNQITEKDLLPSHYTKADEPFFSGRGNHSVHELENICEQYKDLVHQLRIRETSIIRRFNIEIVNAYSDCKTVGRSHFLEDDSTTCSTCGIDTSKQKE